MLSMNRVLLGITLLFVFSCAQNSKDCPAVYFSGEIVNPTSEYVVLFRNDAVVDSAMIDENNRFAFNLAGIEEGLYHFEQFPEVQYVYFEEGDSVLIRLNTVEFDESLVFSGKGSEINNFLIETFLAFEDEESLVYSYYKLKPEEFSVKIDSLRQMKLDLLNDLMAENDFSEKALITANAAIDYSSFIYKEKYPFYHKKRTGEDFMHLSKDFYKYRADLDLNNNSLVYFRPYYDFMKFHFGNLSYMSCAKNCGMENMTVNDHLHFNKHKLVLVDSLIQEKELRNVLFRNIAMDYLLKEHEINEDCDKFIAKFSELSDNENHIAEINDIYLGIRNLQPNNKIPNLKLRNSRGDHIDLKEIAKGKKTVFYFWSGTQKGHFKYVTKHVNQLMKKKPEYNFVGINLLTSHDQWVRMMHESELDTLNQYRGEDFEKVQKAFILNGMDKCVITKDSLIVNAFGNLYASF